MASSENTERFEVSTLQLTYNEMDENKSIKNKVNIKTVSFCQKIGSVSSYITVEPLLICYIFPSILAQIAVLHLNLDKACRVNLNYTEAVCNSIKDGTGVNLTMESTNVQSLVAGIMTWRTPLGKALPAIMSLFVGAWSDRTGNRKALMIIPIIGETVTGLGLLLCVYYFLEWPLEAAGLIEALPTALSGGFSIMLLAVYSYMADITTPEERTFRIGLVVILVTLSVPVGTALSGILLRDWGYYGVFSTCVALYIFGIIYGILRIKNVRKPQESKEGNCFCEFFSPRLVKETIMVAFKSRPGTRQLRIPILMLTFVLIAGPLYGEAELSFLYLTYKFKLNAVDLSLYSTYSSLVGIFGSTLSITVLTKLLKMDDMLMGIVSNVSRIAAELMLAFANTQPLLWAVPVVDLLSHTAVTAIRSTATKLVEPDEVGKVASLIGLLEAIIPNIFSPIFSSVYVATLDYLAGAFYLIGAAITLPSIFTFLILYFLQKKDKNMVSDPETKETFARDNEVTAL